MMKLPCRQRAAGHIVSVAHPAAPQAGETLYTSACEDCHREYGKRHPDHEWRPLPD